MSLDPHVASLAAVSLAVGWLMAWSGVQKSVLELKRRHRTCPSCGRRIQRHACGCTD